ncbi:MAG TPA: hypothetical protein VKN99_22525 [Polyangia bacterium]|nr:hypothetical protein [Polyangia bacterium]
MGLSRWQFIGIFAVALATFLFINGRIWRHPFDVDRSVWWSYLIIPPLVAGCLLASRRFSLRAFGIATVELVLYKFAATYFIATALWAFSSPPAHAPMRVEIPPRRSAVSAPPTALSPERLGNIEGRVAEPGGAPAREALVWIAAGLEGTRFAQRADPVRLENDGRGFSPRVAAAQVGQPLLLRATDGHLHSLKATADQGRTIAFNVAVLASGAWREVTFDRAFGPVALDCTVHHEHGGEERAEVVVLDHPFFGTTSEDGRFRFEKVPAGRLRLAARSGVRTAEATLVLDPRTTAEPILRLSW